jgi:hypothetical protein
MDISCLAKRRNYAPNADLDKSTQPIQSMITQKMSGLIDAGSLPARGPGYVVNRSDYKHVLIYH